jgi:hypothetical protein
MLDLILKVLVPFIQTLFLILCPMHVLTRFLFENAKFLLVDLDQSCCPFDETKRCLPVLRSHVSLAVGDLMLGGRLRTETGRSTSTAASVSGTEGMKVCAADIDDTVDESIRSNKPQARSKARR